MIIQNKSKSYVAVSFGCLAAPEISAELVREHLANLSLAVLDVELPMEAYRPIKTPVAKPPFKDTSTDGFLSITFDGSSDKLQPALDFLTNPGISRVSITAHRYDSVGHEETFNYKNILMRTLKHSTLSSVSSLYTKTLVMSFASSSRSSK